jgi:hypothetical protein
VVRQRAVGEPLESRWRAARESSESRETPPQRPALRGPRARASPVASQRLFFQRLFFQRLFVQRLVFERLLFQRLFLCRCGRRGTTPAAAAARTAARPTASAC